MSLIAEFETSLTQLTEALERVPEMTLQYEESYVTPDGRMKWIVWASGGDHFAFQEALTDDTSVASRRTIAEMSTRRLYRLTLAGDPKDFALAVLTEQDIQVLTATHGRDGTVVRVRCPTREAFASMKAAIEDRYGTFVTRRLYREVEPESDGFSVTPAQREALLAALEDGYFDVPRETTLRVVADRLGISDNALSARLRRGTAALLADTLSRRDS